MSRRRPITLFSGGADEKTARTARDRLTALPELRTPPRLVGDLQLVVTELITNAIKAHSSWIAAELVELDGAIELRVRDDAAGVPAVSRPAQTDTGGRGLRIVEAIADAWGFETEADAGKTVWARFSRVHGAPGAPDGHPPHIIS